MFFYEKIKLRFLFFIIIFILFSFFLNQVVEKNPNYFFAKAIDIKLKLFENRKIDVAFFGSSQIHHGISASTIEQNLENILKKDVNVINFGLPSASLLEQSFILEHLIKKK